jgi:hypothetical protein
MNEDPSTLEILLSRGFVLRVSIMNSSESGLLKGTAVMHDPSGKMFTRTSDTWAGLNHLLDLTEAHLHDKLLELHLRGKQVPEAIDLEEIRSSRERYRY